MARMTRSSSAPARRSTTEQRSRPYVVRVPIIGTSRVAYQTRLPRSSNTRTREEAPLTPPELIVAHVVPATAGRGPSDWTQSLCGCFRNSEILAEEIWCCYCHLGYLHEFLKSGHRSMNKVLCCGTLFADATLLCGLARCLTVMQLRRQLKERYNIVEPGLQTCVTSLCCSWCAMCQMHREMHARKDFTGGLYYMTPPPVMEPAMGGDGFSEVPAYRVTEKVALRPKTLQELGYYVSGQPEELPQYGYSNENCTGYPEKYALSVPVDKHEVSVASERGALKSGMHG